MNAINASLHPVSTSISQHSRTWMAISVMLLGMTALSTDCLAQHVQQKPLTRVTTPGWNARIGGGGIIREDSAIPANFRVHLTDKNGKEIFPNADWPRFLEGKKGADGHYRAELLFGAYGKYRDVKDAWNDVIPIKPKKAGFSALDSGDDLAAMVMLEALYQDENDNWQLENIFDSVLAHAGLDYEIYVPDLAFSDAEGNLLEGQLLYSLVDLNVFLKAGCEFSFGDVLTLQDGKTSSLQGMQFSSTPFSFDPETGFTGTPVDGTGTIIAKHGLTTVPEGLNTGMLAGAMVFVLFIGFSGHSRKPCLT